MRMTLDWAEVLGAPPGSSVVLIISHASRLEGSNFEQIARAVCTTRSGRSIAFGTLAGQVPQRSHAASLRKPMPGAAQETTSAMSHALVTLIAASMVLCASVAVTQSPRDVRGPSPLIAIENEAPPRLIVDPPLPEPLSRGLVFIQYRTENLRIAPVFGKGALQVSPRVGHVHVTVDNVGWHFVDASGETLIVVGLKPGPHKILVELADPTHRVITSETVKFTLPGPRSPDSR